MKVILGGGISGLSAGYYLLKRFPTESFTIIESSGRVGGWIRSINKNGAIIEQGPRSIRPRGITGANTLKLVEDLGLSDKIIAIPNTHPAALNRMVYVNGQLHTLPSSFFSLFQRRPPFSKPLYRYAINYIVRPPKHIPDNDESLYSFVQRRFGDDFADYAISPLICGICAGDTKKISVRFLMDSLFENEQRHKSVLSGIANGLFSVKQKEKIPFSNLYQRAKSQKWSIYSFEGGLEELPKALQNHVQKNRGNVLLNTECNKIEIRKDGVSLLTNKGQSIQADQLISSLPSPILGRLLEDQHPILGNLLKGIPFVTVAVVNLQYYNKLPLKEGFGFLVPPKENVPILGIIFDSCCFNPKETDSCKTQLTVMMGGDWFHKYFSGNDSEDYILSTALEQVNNILHVDEKPSYSKVSILRDCIPQYVVGHRSRINAIENYLKENRLPVVLCGSSYYGVGINDVILSAKSAVDRL